MSNFDYFKQYQSEMKRIKDKEREESNPYHRQHIKEFSEMMDEKIRTQVPAMIQQQQEAQRIEIQTYLNGKRIGSNKDIVNGVRDMFEKALKKFGKGR